MAQVNFRIDDDVKQDADALFDRLGMTLSTAITVFLRQSIARRGLPFEVTEDPFCSPSNQAYLRNWSRLRGRGQQAKRYFAEMREASSDDEMTLDEINAEIAAARKERHAREKALT